MIYQSTVMNLQRINGYIETEVVMIHKGLSVRVAGCLISIERHQDPEVHEASVVVDSGGRLTMASVELEAIKFQAELLRKRAQRFFGVGWRVHPWDGKVSVAADQSSPNRAG